MECYGKQLIIPSSKKKIIPSSWYGIWKKGHHKREQESESEREKKAYETSTWRISSDYGIKKKIFTDIFPSYDTPSLKGEALFSVVSLFKCLKLMIKLYYTAFCSASFEPNKFYRLLGKGGVRGPVNPDKTHPQHHTHPFVSHLSDSVVNI